MRSFLTQDRLRNLRHTLTHPLGRFTIVASLALASTLVPLHAQQGKTRVIPGQFRVANGESLPGTLVFRDGDYKAVFISQATNLAAGAPPNIRSIYVHDCRTGKTTFNSPRDFNAIEVVATTNRPSGANQQKFLFMAAYGHSVMSNTRRIAFYNGTAWNFFPIVGEFRGLQIDISGRFYLLTDTALTEFNMLTNQTRTIMSSPNRSMQRLSVSEDGRILVVNYLDMDGDEPVPYRVILSRRDNDTFVANSRSADVHSIVDISGKLLIEDGDIYQINTDPDNIYLVPAYQDVIPTDARPIDLSQDLLVYTTDNGQSARVISFAERVDIPLEWWDGTTKHRRCIQNGFVLFAARDTQQRGVVRGDNNLLQDMFLYEVTLRRTTGITTGPLPRKGFPPSLAVGHDASLIAFTSNSDDLVEGKTTAHTDVFIQRGQQLIRVRLGNAEPNGSSFDVNVDRSPNGSRVVFASNATNLTTSPDTNNASDVFLWQPGGTAGTISCVTCSYNGESFRPWIAPNGGVFFLSTADNIRPIPSNIGRPQAYFVFPNNPSSAMVFRPSNSSWFDQVEDIAVSPNGQWIALTATIDQTDGKLGVFVYQYPSFVNPSAVFFVPGSDVYATSVSNNGLVVFHTDLALLPGDNNFTSDVYVWNPQNGQLRLASRNNGGIRGNRESFGGTIDAEGRRIAFNSMATNLTAFDTNLIDDVFVFDLQAETLYCATLNDNRLPVGGSMARITGQGSQVAFVTGSAELAELTYTNGVYVGIHEIGCALPGDINGDGIVDDADLLEVLLNYGERKKGFSFVDVNLDGFIDDSDMLIILFQMGASCSFGVAGDGDNSTRNSDPAWELRRTGDGYAILHFHKPPKPYRIDLEETQSDDIQNALKARDWPYPVVGGMTNLWKETLGDPSAWTPEDRLAMKQFLTPERPGSGGGDFQPAAGIPGYFSAEYPLINWQANSNTYVRLTPKFTFTAGCTQGIEAAAEVVLDLKIFGFGSDELAKARAFAGITPNYIGYGVEAYLTGNKIWGIGQYVNSPSYTWTNQQQTSMTLFKGGVTFAVFGVPMVFTYDVEGWLRRTINFQLTSVPVNAQFQFIPEVGIDADLGLGIGFSLFGTYFNAGLQLVFDPVVSLGLPFTAQAGLAQQNNQCVFNAGASLDLTFRALRGRLDLAVNTSCMGLLGLLCKKCQPNQPAKIFGFIPAKCCSDQCYILGFIPYGKKRKVELDMTIAQWNGIFITNNIWQDSWSEPIK